MRVITFDQIDRPRALPEPERLLAPDGDVNVCERLKPHLFWTPYFFVNALPVCKRPRTTAAVPALRISVRG